MANCHSIFKNYDSELILTDDRKEKLKKSRKRLRKRIKNYFKEEKPKEIKPKFSSQGSFVMGTIINPIPVEKDGKKLLKYDVDDGVYFLGDESEDDRYKESTYHNWIYDAVYGFTFKQVDKNTCVRVIYHDGHNIDLPIYYKQNETPELAHKSDGWTESDPKEFKDWFLNLSKDNKQLKRLIRYIKGWCNYRNYVRNDKKMPSGLVMTILVSNNKIYNDRDDIALRDTLINIQEKLEESFVCERPTTPKGENLLDDYTNRDYFLKELDNFIVSAKQAIEEDSQKEACKKWKKHFGNRFRCGDATDNSKEVKSYARPDIISSNAKSA